MSSLKRKAADLAAAEAKKPKANGSITSFFATKPSTAPASSPASGSATAAPSDTASATPSAKFDKEKWVSKLTDEQKDLLKLEIDTLHESWLAQLKEEILKPTFLDLKRFLKKEKQEGKTIFPPLEDVYSWYLPIPLTPLPIAQLTNHLTGPVTLPYTPSKP
jgi:uracil-DNA glycosylase